MICSSNPGIATITVRSTADTSQYTTCTVTVQQNKATNKNVTWASNAEIATVSDSGIVTGVAPGTVTVYVRSVENSNYNYATCSVTVGGSISYTTMSENITYSGSIGTGQGKWYKFTPSVTKTYTFETIGSTNIYGVLYQGSNRLTSGWDSQANNFSISYKLTAGTEYRLLVLGKSASVSGSFDIRVGDVFNYNSSTYSQALATKCAEYAMLAYDEMELSGGYYVDSKNRKNQPDALISKLKTDGFTTVTNSDAHNYSDTDPDNVAYVLAKKPVLVNGSLRTLIAVIIRGTNRDEWQGNMDITGSSYNSSLNDHYSWKAAENDLKATLNTYTDNISNPVYLITGHSRGAAVANLLANTLTSSFGAFNVFAYTFATPNATKNQISRTNIFNFVFNDDFVTKSPLEGATTGWGYSKHGITKTKVAEDLYSNSANASTFKADMIRFLGGREADYNYDEVLDLVEHVKDKWDDVTQYYNNACFNGPTIPGTAIPVTPAYALIPTYWQTLYEFMHDEVAKAAMGDFAAKVLVGTKAPNYYFGPISLFFIDGNALNNYIFDTHHAFTYYTAVKHGLFN